MKTQSIRGRLLASTVIGSAALLAISVTPAAAQQATAVDEVVVTGSRIARQDYVSNSPIVTVGADDFQATGSPTIDGLLNDLPQFQPGINMTSNNPSNGGQANLNLRGLGSNRTLVLMNGRRVVPSGASSVVDVNLIPTALIQNVEIITGGASAAYGSDAIAGVANFILNQNFEGLQFDGQYGITDADDGVTESYSVTMGGNFAGDRGNVVLSLGRSTREPIFNLNREFSAVSGPSGASPLGSTTFDALNAPSQSTIDNYLGVTGVTSAGGQFGFNNDGTLFSYVGGHNFKSPGGLPYDGFTGGGNDFLYNTGPLNYLVLPMDRWNAYASGRYRINDSIEFYSDLLFTQYTSANELAATPAAAGTGFRVPYDNPFIGANSDLRALLNDRPDPTGSFQLNKRFTDLGGRRGNESYDVYQITSGIRGALPIRDWTYDVYAQYGRVDNVTSQTGNVSRSSVQTLLDDEFGGAGDAAGNNVLCAGGFNPFGDQNTLSPECAAFIGRASKNTTVSEQTVVEAVVQGGLFVLPAGEVRFAGGVQYRENNYAFSADALLAQQNPSVPHENPRTGLPDGGNVGGSEIAGFNPGDSLSGMTNSVELFGEVLVPLLADLPLIQQLDLTVGYRYADYNTVGGTTAYNVALDWAVVEGLRLRGGVQRSVRAPTIGELFGPLDTGFPGIGNPTNAAGAAVYQGDPCDIRGAYRNGPDGASVRAMCLAQGVPAAIIDSFQFPNNQVQGLSGGNPGLMEETADSFTVGAVWQSRFASPYLSGLSASIDYYNIEIDDVVGSIGTSLQLQGCFNAPALGGINASYDPNNGYCQLFQRDPANGQIVMSVATLQNLATLKTSGIDLQVDYALDVAEIGGPDIGLFRANLVVGWLENWERQDAPGGPITERTGTLDSGTFGNTYPEWKLSGSLSWNNGPFGLNARWRRVGEMLQFATTDVILEPLHYFDLMGTWNVNDTVTLRAGVNNIGDQQPNTFVPGIQANTDPSTYDVLGRRYFVGLTARF